MKYFCNVNNSGFVSLFVVFLCWKYPLFNVVFRQLCIAYAQNRQNPNLHPSPKFLVWLTPSRALLRALNIHFFRTTRCFTLVFIPSYIVQSVNQTTDWKRRTCGPSIGIWGLSWNFQIYGHNGDILCTVRWCTDKTVSVWIQEKMSALPSADMICGRPSCCWTSQALRVI